LGGFLWKKKKKKKARAGVEKGKAKKKNEGKGRAFNNVKKKKSIFTANGAS